jgi:flagellar hook-associated protein 2
VLFLVFSDGSTRLLPPVQNEGDFQKFSYKLSDYSGGKEVVAMDLVNRNTHRDVSIRSIQVYDPDARGGMKPLSPIATARDALLSMDGINIRRASNTIKDLIPGVTLNLAGESAKPIKLAVEPDRETAKDAIIAMVGNYNRLLAEVNVLTRRDDKIVQELSYLDEDERKTLEERMGTLQGDSTLNQLKANLQRVASSPFPTAAERDMALLTQLGISTDARQVGSGQGYDASRLRGYLEINEKTMDAALKANLPAIKQLFGNDTDGDLIIDSGFGYSVDNLIKPYVETGGLIALKSTGIDSKVTQENRRIENYDKQLVAKESELKRQYGLMEGALNRMEQTSGSIDQFNNRSNN